MPQNTLLTISETAKILGVSTKTLRRWEDSGTLTSIRTAGGHRRYQADQVFWLKENSHKRKLNSGVVTKLLPQSKVQNPSFSTPFSLEPPLSQPLQQIQKIPNLAEIKPELPISQNFRTPKINFNWYKPLQIIGTFSLIVIILSLAVIGKPFFSQILSLNSTQPIISGVKLDLSLPTQESIEKDILGITTEQNLTFLLNIPSLFKANSRIEAELYVTGDTQIDGTLNLGQEIVFNQNGDILSNTLPGYIISSGGLGVGGSNLWGISETGNASLVNGTFTGGVTVAGPLTASNIVTLGDGGDYINLNGSNIDLTSATSIALKPSSDTDDYIYLTTTLDQPGVFFAGTATTNDPGIRINTLSGQIEYRDQNTETWTPLDSLKTDMPPQLLTDGGTYLYPSSRESLRIYDSTGTDYIDISHNGTDVLLTTNNTNLINIDNSVSITGNLSLAEGSLLDLSAITHQNSTPQGLKLPQNTSLTAPSSGEGFLAYDTSSNEVMVYNGSSWANISGASTTLQQAYEAGNTLDIISTESDFAIDLQSANMTIAVGQGTDTGDFRIWDGTDDWLFIDESADSLLLGEAASSISIGTASNITTINGNLNVSGRLDTSAHQNNSGLNIPTSAGAPSAVTGTSEGDIVFDTVNNALYVYDGGSFTQIGEGAYFGWTLDGDDSDTQAIDSGNTVLIAGGTNGIDTDVSATDTITLNLDTTEIDTTTFGSGTDFTWTFNTSGSDPTLTFGSGSLTTTGLLNVAGTFQLASGATGLNNVSTDLTSSALSTDLATALAIKTYVDNQIGGSTAWGVNNNLVYTLANRPIAATSSATTVATFTAGGTNDSLRAGGTSNYLTVDQNGHLKVTANYGLDTLAAGELKLGDTTATTVSLGSTAATTLNFGAGGSLARAINIGTGTGVDTINIGTGGTGADVITFGGGVGTVAINSGDWDISTTGDLTGIGNISLDGRLDTAAHTNNTGLNLPTNAGVPSGVTGTAEGDIVYDTTNDALYIYDGAAFSQIGGGGYTGWTLDGDDGDTETINSGNTVLISGGTNGIDTDVSATDTITLNLDTTEIGTTTFGAGSALTWTFDASGGTDSTLAFGDNTTAFTTGTLSTTGDLTVSGGDILGANSAAIDLGEAVSGDISFFANGDTDDYLYLNTASNIPGLYWEGIASTDPGIYVTGSQLGYRDGDGTWVAFDDLEDAATPNFWQENLGALSPYSSTLDLLIGGTSTSSAKFAFINTLTNTPTASIAGTTTNVATYLTGEGNLATTNMAPLTLGGLTTGSIQLSPKNATGLFVDGGGNVGIGTTNPSQALDVIGKIEVNNIVALNLPTTAAGALFVGDGGANTGANDDYNTALGINALYSLNNSTALRNTALGYNALNLNTGGDDNLAIGYNSLDALTTGSQNIAIGNNSLTEFNGSYMLAIGYGAMDAATSGEKSVAIGTDALGSAISSSWNTAIGYKALDVSTGSYNTAVGNEAGGSVNTGTNNTFLGNAAGGGVTSGSNNVFVGSSAGSSTITGSNNIGIGNDPGGAITGSDNILFGRQTGENLTSGSSNIFTGVQAGRNFTTGTFNIAIGDNAAYGISTQASGSDNNILLGQNSGRGLGADSDNNILIGQGAGYNLNDTSNNNLAIGYQAGYSLSDSTSANIFLGYQAGYNETGSNKLYIENSNSTSPLIYGDFAADILSINGSLGIGTNDPDYKLQVSGGDIDVMTGNTYRLAGVDVGQYFIDSAGSSGQIWTSDADGKGYWADATGSTNFWQLNDKQVSPVITSYDLLIGGTSTASANVQAFGIETTTGELFSLNSDTITTGTVLDLNADALTTGDALNITSLSTGLSTGSLLDLYWNPGSATTSTGDLFKLDTGSNATVNGNLLAIYNNGSPIFTVSPTQITSAVPHSFTSAGDVSFTYDAVFTNQTSSMIESYGPFTLKVGESFENNDLTLKTYGTGDVVADMGGDLVLYSADPSLVFDTLSATDTDFWLGVQEDAGNDNDDYLALGSGTTIGSNEFFRITSTGNASHSASLALGPMLQVDAGTCDASNEGRMYYDAIQNKYYFCDGSSWSAMEGAGSTQYWSELTGVLSPASSQPIAATSSATTVATFTASGTNTALRTGGTADYLTVNQTGDISLTGSADTIDKVSGTLNLNTTNNQAITTGTGLLTAGGDLAVTGGDITGANSAAIDLGEAVSGNIQLLANGDTSDFLYAATTGNEAALFFENAAKNYTNDVGIKVNGTTGKLEYRDEDSASWVAFDSFTTGGGTNLWQLNGEVVSPSITGYDLTIGGTATSGAKFRAAGLEVPTGGLIDITSTAITSGSVLDLTASALTTGTLFNATSTSTALTSGKLGYFNWEPATPATASGDLFVLNIGAHGDLTGNLFNITDSGSSLFKVSTSKITSALPHEFTAAGDVSIAYDLVFTNQTASDIQSYGPLTISSGESFENNNLTLKTYGTGDLVFDNDGISTGILTDTAQLGLGTTSPGYKLHVTDSSTSTASAFIENSADVGTNNVYGMVIKMGADADNPATTDRYVNFLRGDGTTVGSISGNGSGAVAFNSNGVDFAEYFKKADSNESLPPGTLVCQSSSGITACNQTNSQILGVVSTAPAFVGGSDKAGDPAYVLVGLVGQVPVLVSPENGPITAGDILTISSTLGVAAKATGAGFVVGRALDNYTSDTQGVITLALNPTYFDPGFNLDLTGNLNVGNLVTIDNQLTVSGRNILGELDIVNSAVAINTVSLDNLSHTVATHTAELASIQTATNRLDESFLSLSQSVDASLSAQALALNTLENYLSTNNDLILDQAIAITDDKINNLSNNIVTLDDKIAALESQIASLSASVRAMRESPSSLTIDDLLTATASAVINDPLATLPSTLEDLTLTNLIVTDHTTLNEVGVTGNLTIGFIQVDGLASSLTTTLEPLRLQTNPLAGNVEVFNQNIVMTPDGSITAKGTLTAQKVITPDLEVQGAVLGKLTIATESAQLASASAVVADLASATGSPSSTLFTPSIGTATLPAGQTLMIVNNPQISATSKVFITPVGYVDQVISVVDVLPETGFVVSIPSPATKDFTFNWWIIN